MVRDFYDKEGIKEKKTVVFSDSLNIEHCLEYKTIAEEAGFTPVFGVGTFFTSEFCPSSPAASSSTNPSTYRRFYE
jgi:nicotinate phosphoribosyltransferase